MLQNRYKRGTSSAFPFLMSGREKVADLVAVLNGLGLLEEGLEGGFMHGGPGHAAGGYGVQHSQQHIAVAQRLRQVLDVHLVPQQAQQPHPERALLP